MTTSAPPSTRLKLCSDTRFRTPRPSSVPTMTPTVAATSAIEPRVNAAVSVTKYTGRRNTSIATPTAGLVATNASLRRSKPSMPTAEHARHEHDRQERSAHGEDYPGPPTGSACTLAVQESHACAISLVHQVRRCA